MEKWQTDHITKNLEILLINTKCSAILKAGLKARELLTDEEDEKLTALGHAKGSINETKLLYEIMMTRTRGYSGLMDVLRNGRQDGALTVLLEGLQQQTKLQAVSSDSITQLMSMRFQQSNCTKSFIEVFPNFTRDDAMELLQNSDLNQELEEMVGKGSKEIKLDGELPITPSLYIPRLLSNRLHLDPRVFALDNCEDVFVFQNIYRMDLSQLVKPYAVRSSTNQRSLVTSRHIYLDDPEDWDDMAANSESPIHLVTKEGSGYILQKTTNFTDVLENYVLRERRSKETFVTEDAILQDLLCDKNSNGALICDVAGMGKTWLMQSIAAKLRDKRENVVTFFMELSSFSKSLSAYDETQTDSNGLTLFLSYGCNSKLAMHLLHKHAAPNGLKIVIVLDGYDELNKDDIELVQPNLEVVSNLDNVSMIISSRPNVRAFLQKTFDLISYDILPFETKQQVSCIVNQWTNACPQTDSNTCKLDEFALQCIKSVKSIQKDDIHDILGVPLKCRILATVNEKQAKQLCNVKRRRPLEVVEAATIKSVFDLYTMFIDTLVDKVAQTLPPDSRKDFVNDILTFHTHLALKLLFPDLSSVYHRDCKIDSSTEAFFIRVGVAFFNQVQQRLEFMHRSLAEYFMGRYFAELWNNIEQFSPSLVQRVGSYFIRNVLIAADDTDCVKIFTHPFIRIKYIPGIHNFPMLLDTKKLFQLKYPLILLFMNLKSQKWQFPKSAQHFQKIAVTVETEAISATKSFQLGDKIPKQEEGFELKRWLTESSLVTMMACIDERLTNLFSLYVNILISFFDLQDRVDLLIPPDTMCHDFGYTECAAWLLCRVAMSSSPENAVELFNLFGGSEQSYFTVLCRYYPQQYLSPLEVAIKALDFDMTQHFVDKVSLPFYRLFFTCVAVDFSRREVAGTNMDVKLKIMKIVLGSSDHVLDILTTDNLYRYEKPAVMISKYSFQVLMKFIQETKRSLSSITSENKRFFLETCLDSCNDEETVHILQSLYGKCGDKKLSIQSLSADQAKDTFSADYVLDALDLEQVRLAFTKVKLGLLPFHCCLNVETLKVLMSIVPDLSCCNYEKWNYLHLATMSGKIKWIEHLIYVGYDVNQKDDGGSTALLHLSSGGIEHQLLRMTRLLVENGADVYATDKSGQNVAHQVCDTTKSLFTEYTIEDLSEWVSYMLDKGYHRLWEMRDNGGRTPQEMLLKAGRGDTHKKATEVKRLLESYSIECTN